jgi:protein involved in polysaccharide export with SLBB domain
MPRLKILLTLILIAFSTIVFSQIPALPANLSNVRSSDIPDERVSQIVTYLRENKISDQQAYEQMLSRGMLAAEALALRTRIQKGLQEVSSQSLPKNNKESLDNSDKSRYQETQQSIAEVKNPNKIFGLEIFSNSGVLAFEPNLKIATPVNYIIGPDDEIVLNIFGYQEANYTLTVSPDGSIVIPNVGVIYVAGLTIEQATQKIKAKLVTSGYSLIRSGLTKINVSIGRIRSIKVTILGEVRKPGSYTLPSLATAFNALYLSGGPNEIGSFRKVEIIRNGKIIETLDIYDFLVKGDQSGNVQLRDQDVIRIPPYDIRVALGGEVKRPGLFEVLPGETFQTVLNFAGGFSDSAYTASVTAYKSTDTEKRILDIEKTQYATYTPGRSESFLVKKLIERYTNRVTVSGAVYLPGDYELSPGMTLHGLLTRAQGLKEDAFVNRGIIIRYRPDLTPEYISFNPAEVMQEKNDVPLQRNDEVIITSNTLLKEERQVSITGEVRRVGAYPYVENMSLKDLVLLAGGFTDAAIPQKIEIARRLRKDSFGVADIQIAEVIDVSSIADLEQNTRDVRLSPYDAVVVRRNPGYQTQVNVRVEGEVLFPGPYVLRNKNERISELLNRAGGITAQAYKQGGYLTRKNYSTVLNQLNTQKVSKIQEQLKDSTGRVEQEVARPVDQIAINISSILTNPGGKEDIALEDGDILTIPKEKMEVRINGEVLFPTRVVYEEDMDLKDYIGRAGGFTDNARKARVYVLYPNGNAAKTSNFIFLKSYPRITPGSEIIVPKKHETEPRRMTTGEIVGITTALTSFAGVLLTLIINLK